MTGIEIKQWGELTKERGELTNEGEEEAQRPSLILGNGASIALHSEFQYSSLYDVVEKKKGLTWSLPHLTCNLS